jgi:hypothetical protein
LCRPEPPTLSPPGGVPLDLIRAAERELRQELSPLVADGRLRELAHDG